jgi:hypothetical protein
MQLRIKLLRQGLKTHSFVTIAGDLADTYLGYNVVASSELKNYVTN